VAIEEILATDSTSVVHRLLHYRCRTKKNAESSSAKSLIYRDKPGSSLMGSLGQHRRRLRHAHLKVSPSIQHAAGSVAVIDFTGTS
jgi:hypothetical protein